MYTLIYSHIWYVYIYIYIYIVFVFVCFGTAASGRWAVAVRGRRGGRIRCYGFYCLLFVRLFLFYCCYCFIVVVFGEGGRNGTLSVGSEGKGLASDSPVEGSREGRTLLKLREAFPGFDYNFTNYTFRICIYIYIYIYMYIERERKTIKKELVYICCSTQKETYTARGVKINACALLVRPPAPDARRAPPL